MSYLTHNDFRQKKDLLLQKLLASQKANQTGIEQAVVKKYHAVYGNYFEIISHQEADQAGERVLFIGRCLPIEGIQSNTKRSKSKSADNKGKPAGD